jgi:hypothetical protein
VLACADAKGMIHLWSSSNWRRQAKIRADLVGGEAFSVCWSTDGQQLASASPKGRICIWTGFSGVQAPVAVEVVSSNSELKPIHPEQRPPTPSRAPLGAFVAQVTGCLTLIKVIIFILPVIIFILWIIFWIILGVGSGIARFFGL